MIEATLAFHLRQIAVLDVVALGRAFDEPEKVTQIFAFCGFKLGEFDTDAERWAALGNDSGQDETLDPDLSIGQPETDFYVYSGRHGRGGLHETSTQPGVGQIPPDRYGRVTQTQFDCYETLHAGMAAAVLV